MNRIHIKGLGNESVILVGEKLRNVSQYISTRDTIIVTDTNVQDIYGDRFPPCQVIVIGIGESNKTLETVASIYEKLIDLEADRSTYIVGIGGGIVCDIAGFVASTYMRGLRFGYVSTTLLSQVDASVGGKTGVNYQGYKNMVGVFNQPEFVICDLSLLSTLPKREISCGFAEVVKCAAIADADMFSYLEKHYEEALSLTTDVIENLVYRSIQIKAEIVSRDERESGERRKLNLGHTFGHAIEKTTDFSHGEAVGIGMLAASAFSVAKGLIDEEDHDRLKRLLENLDLPTRIHMDVDRIWEALQKDKKRERGNINFVLLEKIGRAVVKNFPIQDVHRDMAFLKGVCL